MITAGAQVKGLEAWPKGNNLFSIQTKYFNLVRRVRSPTDMPLQRVAVSFSSPRGFVKKLGTLLKHIAYLAL